MRRWVLALAALVVASALVGCADSGTSGGPGTPGGSATAIGTVEDLASALERGHGREPWFAEVTGVTLETMLGAPVVAVRVTWSSAPDDWETVNAAAQAIGDALSAIDQSVSPNAVMMFSDGAFVDVGSSGVAGFRPMYEAFELPPAPQTADEVRQWLGVVYGPGGLVTLGPDERWLSSITSITLEDLGYAEALVVKSSLPTYASTDTYALQRALTTCGSPLLTDYTIETADGTGSAGSVGTLGRPGFGGWLYPSQ